MDSIQEEQAPSLLEQRRALEEATKNRIGELLVIREQGQINWDQKLEDVAAELKELGYKRPRAAAVRRPKPAAKKETKKSVDKSVSA